MRGLERALIPVCILAMLLFTAVGIRRSVWLDEANCNLISSHGLSEIIEGLRRDNNAPAYYVLLAIWARVAGNSEIAFRVLSGACYAAGAAATFFLGLSIYRNRRIACYCAFFYLASTQAIQEAQNIRMYAFLGLFRPFRQCCLSEASTRANRRAAGGW